MWAAAKSHVFCRGEECPSRTYLPPPKRMMSEARTLQLLRKWGRVPLAPSVPLSPRARCPRAWCQEEAAPIEAAGLGRRLRAPGPGPRVGDPLCASAARQAWTGALHCHLIRSDKAQNPEIHRTGWPQGLDTQETPGAQGPDTSGAPWGKLPVNICNPPPCCLLPKLLPSPLA